MHYITWHKSDSHHQLHQKAAKSLRFSRFAYPKVHPKVHDYKISEKTPSTIFAVRSRSPSVLCLYLPVSMLSE